MMLRKPLAKKPKLNNNSKKQIFFHKPVCNADGFLYIYFYMITKEALLKIGVLTKPHGISGEVLVRLIPELSGTEPDPSWLFIDVLGGLVPFEVISSRTKGDVGLLLELDTLTDENKVNRFKGSEVYIDPLELGENDNENDTNLNINVLIGSNVIDEKFGSIGVISAIHDIRQNPLAEIDYKGKSILIPLQDEFILSFDKKKRILSIKTPPGLIDLYLE